MIIKIAQTVEFNFAFTVSRYFLYILNNADLIFTFTNRAVIWAECNPDITWCDASDWRTHVRICCRRR